MTIALGITATLLAGLAISCFLLAIHTRRIRHSNDVRGYTLYRIGYDEDERDAAQHEEYARRILRHTGGALPPSKWVERGRLR